MKATPEMIDLQIAVVDRLKDEMHNAPLNPVYMDHDGHRHLGNHSTAWARKSREWGEARAKLLEMEGVLA